MAVMVPVQVDLGDLFTMEEWNDALKRGAFNPHDGSGCWATATEYDRMSSVWSRPIPEWATHVMWFNK